MKKDKLAEEQIFIERRVGAFKGLTFCYSAVGMLCQSFQKGFVGAI